MRIETICWTLPIPYGSRTKMTLVPHHHHRHPRCASCYGTRPARRSLTPSPSLTTGELRWRSDQGQTSWRCWRLFSSLGTENTDNNPSLIAGVCLCFLHHRSRVPPCSSQVAKKGLKTLPARWMLIANAHPDAATSSGGGWVRRHPDGARTKQDRPDFPERDWPVSQVHNNQSHEAYDDDMMATTINPIQTGSTDVMKFFLLFCDDNVISDDLSMLIDLFPD